MAFFGVRSESRVEGMKVYRDLEYFSVYRSTIWDSRRKSKEKACQHAAQRSNCNLMFCGDRVVRSIGLRVW